MYLLLSTDGQAYLHLFKDGNSLYIRGILIGKKKIRASVNSQMLKFLWNNQMKCGQVLQTDKLTVKKVLAFAIEHLFIHRYLPEYKKGKPPTEYGLWTLIISITLILNSQFSAWKRVQRVHKQCNDGKIKIYRLQKELQSRHPTKIHRRFLKTEHIPWNGVFECSPIWIKW